MGSDHRPLVQKMGALPTELLYHSVFLELSACEQALGRMDEEQALVSVIMNIKEIKNKWKTRLTC